jgi:hypothetical protein
MGSDRRVDTAQVESPKQIEGRRELNRQRSISHETIYRRVRLQRRSAAQAGICGGT